MVLVLGIQMRKKLTEKPLEVVVGALYQTFSNKTPPVPFVSYEENGVDDFVLTQTGEIFPQGTLMLCLHAGVPKRFFLVESKRNIFAFAVRGLKLVSLPQTDHPASSPSKSP